MAALKACAASCTAGLGLSAASKMGAEKELAKAVKSASESTPCGSPEAQVEIAMRVQQALAESSWDLSTWSLQNAAEFATVVTMFIAAMTGFIAVFRWWRSKRGG